MGETFYWFFHVSDHLEQIGGVLLFLVRLLDILLVDSDILHNDQKLTKKR